jgi:hypothetical protein
MPRRVVYAASASAYGIPKGDVQTVRWFRETTAAGGA